jgi:hypothetical protein
LHLVLRLRGGKGGAAPLLIEITKWWEFKHQMNGYTSEYELCE